MCAAAQLWGNGGDRASEEIFFLQSLQAFFVLFTHQFIIWTYLVNDLFFRPSLVREVLVRRQHRNYPGDKSAPVYELHKSKTFFFMLNTFVGVVHLQSTYIYVVHLEIFFSLISKHSFVRETLRTRLTQQTIHPSSPPKNVITTTPLIVARVIRDSSYSNTTIRVIKKSSKNSNRGIYPRVAIRTRAMIRNV